MEEISTYVGLDVHAETISVCALAAGAGGEEVFCGTITATPEALGRLIGRLKAAGAAAAAVLNITAADPTGVGFVVAYPCGIASPSSTLNVVPARNTSNTAIVAPGANGAVCIQSNTSIHLLVDVTAWIIDGYTGLTPWRAYDSRTIH